MAEREISEETKTGGSKQQILDAALIEFAKYGYAGARVDRIAKKAGVNKAMIYYHFSSKKNLYQSIMELGLKDRVRFLQESMSASDDYEQFFREAAGMFFGLFADTPTMGHLFLRELVDPEEGSLENLANTIRETGMPDRIVETIDNGVRDGKLRPIDGQQAWASFITLNLGYFLLSPFIDRVLNVTDKEAFISERRTAVVDLFLNGVRAK